MEIKLLIATCVEYYATTIPKLLQNLEKIGYPKKEILIVSGGEEKEDEVYENNVQVIKVPWRCFEFTPLIYISELPMEKMADYYFLIHDNVRLESNFHANFQNVCEQLSKNKLLGAKLQTYDPSMNIGIYSKELVHQVKSDLALFKYNNNSKDFLNELKYKLISQEDKYFRSFHLPALVDDSKDKKVQIIKNNNSGRVYKVSIYSTIGLTKVQQNFDPKNMGGINVPEFIVSDS